MKTNDGPPSKLDSSDSELLSAFLDKELDSNELIRVKDLLALSNEWREELIKLQSAKKIMTSTSPLAAPPDLVELLLRQAESHAPSEEKRWWIFPRIWVLTGSMAAAAVVLISYWAGHHPVNQIQYLELETLLAVHEGNEGELSTHQGIIAATNYSEELKESAMGEGHEKS